jgi:Zn-dependent protease with chaperone function
MAGLNTFLVQVLQPYFFYSIAFLVIAFACIKIFLRFNPSTSRRNQSLLWLLPLFIPIFVLLCFPPQTQITAFSLSTYQAQVPTGMGIMFLDNSVFSFTGSLCIGGAIVALGYLVFMLVFGRKIAMKRFHVVVMVQDEYLSLQEKVKETAHKLGISEPKVGLVEDLMPNAFTLGYGQNTMVVFSLGLLKMLTPEELGAVVSHELAHVKAKDYLFKSLSYTLNLVSFFNPLSYFAASQAQKERELLADQKGVALLNKPALMANVLTKLEALAPQFPKAGLVDRLSSSLFLVSPLAHRPAILASHPQIALRVQNINTVTSKSTKAPRRMIATLMLLAILVSAALITAYSTVQVQKTTLQKENAILEDNVKVIVYNATITWNSPPTGFTTTVEGLADFLAPTNQQNASSGLFQTLNGIDGSTIKTVPNP